MQTNSFLLGGRGGGFLRPIIITTLQLMLCACTTSVYLQPKQISPSSSLLSMVDQNQFFTESNGIIMAPVGPSTSSQDMAPIGPSASSQAILRTRMSVQELRQQFSNTSSNSVESVNDMMLAKSMIMLQRWWMCFMIVWLPYFVFVCLACVRSMVACDCRSVFNCVCYSISNSEWSADNLGGISPSR